MDRDQAKSATRKPKATSTEATTTIEITTKSASTTSKMPSSIQDQLTAIDATKKPKQVIPSVNIDDVLKQYNLAGLDIATTSKSSTYGTSNDAILASILKEQGIAPSTPRSLEVAGSIRGHTCNQIYFSGNI